MKEADGWSRALWKQYVDLGLTALPFAEEHGGHRRAGRSRP
jgi:alkylation response protein AidB-like acyl-CoA dehydrogenase